MIACGVLALAFSGGVNLPLSGIFTFVLVIAWLLEGKKWQLSERGGLLIVLLSLPLFYIDWKFQSSVVERLENGRVGISALVHLTLFLSSVKLLQVKADRDWLFLYLISFFEVLLAAGLSVSPTFLLALGVYVFCALLTIICFELRKARRVVPHNEGRLLVERNKRFWQRAAGSGSGDRSRRKTEVFGRLPVAALALLILIFALALPIFFVTPRATDSALAMSGGTGSTGYVGFSDQMTLGDIGELQQNDQLVMRVRVEGPQSARRQDLRWRGVALDSFSGRGWQRSSGESWTLAGTERNFFRLGTTEDLSRLTVQTFFVEPIDTPVLFVAPRAVAVQGALPFIKKDSGDGLVSRMHAQERISYRAYSDTVEPDAEQLRADRSLYPRRETANLRLPIERYLQLPDDLDTRVANLARSIVGQSGARNRYDAARAIEAHLNRNEYGGGYSYSLQMRAGGPDPLSDFLFRVRAGHCEYFSTAMTVMLRTRGIAARVVNGFQRGEYNSAADAYTVRQSDAHSWVEVYFPETDSWVTFDPTPAAGRPGGGTATGLRAQLQKYSEALELFWIQYVVSYDRQEQRSLAQSLRGSLGSYRLAAAQSAGDLKSRLAAWWNNTPDGEASAAIVPVLAGALALVALVLVALRQIGFKFKRASRQLSPRQSNASVVKFYERMTKVLASRGLKRPGDQTPLEFAVASGVPEALTVTQAYHRVRYGARHLSETEAAEIERCLKRLEEQKA
jgi:transglutaminase-like putative cysteine protease